MFRTVNEMKQKTIQGNTGKDMKLLSINSVQFNRNCSVLTAKLNSSAGQNSIMVPYKIETGSDGNMMPEHIFKNFFQKSKMSI